MFCGDFGRCVEIGWIMIVVEEYDNGFMMVDLVGESLSGGVLVDMLEQGHCVGWFFLPSVRL